MGLAIASVAVDPPGVLVWVGVASLCAWLVLVFARGRFWLCDQRLPPADEAPQQWPAVTAVVPARNEAEVIRACTEALLAQDYPGPFQVLVVDDESDDGTGKRALTAARGEHAVGVQVVETPPRPAGWVGKMWAVHTGVARSLECDEPPRWLWLSDADVAPAPGTLRRLVAQGERHRLDLVSVMVRLHCEAGWERLLVPAFVYFFQKLYPFPKVNDPASPVAGAAGGCMLVRADALARTGGIETVRGEVIDDCALARRLKAGGPIWLGFAGEERSLRPYTGLREIWEMVARSAYTQLDHSPWLLAGTLIGLLLVYAAPPLLLLLAPLHGDLLGALLGGTAWIAMAATFLPTLSLYGRRTPWAFALPVAGALYAAMTLDSARRHWCGRGAVWKGRAQAGR